jgi:hypothetical protein
MTTRSISKIDPSAGSFENKRRPALEFRSRLSTSGFRDHNMRASNKQSCACAQRTRRSNGVPDENRSQRCELVSINHLRAHGPLDARPSELPNEHGRQAPYLVRNFCWSWPGNDRCCRLAGSVDRAARSMGPPADLGSLKTRAGQGEGPFSRHQDKGDTTEPQTGRLAADRREK